MSHFCHRFLVARFFLHFSSFSVLGLFSSNRPILPVIFLAFRNLRFFHSELFGNLTSIILTMCQLYPGNSEMQLSTSNLRITSRLLSSTGSSKEAKPDKSQTATASKQPASKMTNGKTDTVDKMKDEMTKLKCRKIQKDPNVSTVYKSLFTTSEACLRQPKPHWITHNPQYY